MAKGIQGARSTESLATRFESLIRLAEAIRSHRDHNDRFPLLADELRHVVPFDGMGQFDPTGNRVNWHFRETYPSGNSQVSDIPKEESVARWVQRTHQALVIQVIDEETRFSLNPRSDQ